jgi:hypothetical protein
LSLNSKKQIPNTGCFLEFGLGDFEIVWNLGFGAYLLFGACYLEFVIWEPPGLVLSSINK